MRGGTICCHLPGNVLCALLEVEPFLSAVVIHPLSSTFADLNMLLLCLWHLVSSNSKILGCKPQAGMYVAHLLSCSLTTSQQVGRGLWLAVALMAGLVQAAGGVFSAPSVLYLSASCVSYRTCVRGRGICCSHVIQKALFSSRFVFDSPV